MSILEETWGKNKSYVTAMPFYDIFMHAGSKLYGSKVCPKRLMFRSGAWSEETAHWCMTKRGVFCCWIFLPVFFFSFPQIGQLCSTVPSATTFLRWSQSPIDWIFWNLSWHKCLLFSFEILSYFVLVTGKWLI